MSRDALFNRIPPNLTVKEVIENMEKRKKPAEERSATISLKTAKRRAALTEQVKKSLAIAAPQNAAAGMRAGVEFGGFLTVPCTEILPYDRNPRQSANPKHGEIKAAIRERHGLQDTTLSITRRPGSDRYMLYMGGNTRLKILQELYSETQDPAYLMVKCVFVEWKSEADTLSAHLVENEARADTTFFEKARGVSMLKSEIERERDTPLSLAQLSDETGRLGMRRATSTLIEYLFAVEHLEKAASWLTKDATNRVRTTHQSLAKIADAENVFQQTFEDCMSSQYKKLDDMNDEASDLPDSSIRAPKDVPAAERAEALRARMIAAFAQHLEVPDAALARIVPDAQIKPDHDRIRAALKAARNTGRENSPAASTKAAPTTAAKTPEGPASDAPQTSAKTTAAHSAAPRSPARSVAPSPNPDQRPQSPSPGAGFVDSEAYDDATLSAHIDDPVALFEAQLARFCTHFSLHDLLNFSDSMPYRFWLEWPETNTPLDGLDTDEATGIERALAYIVLASLSGQLDELSAPLLPADSRWVERFTAGSFDHQDGPFDLQYQNVLNGLVGDNGGTFGVGWQGLHAIMSNPSLWGWVEMLVSSWQGLIDHLETQE